MTHSPSLFVIAITCILHSSCATMKPAAKNDDESKWDAIEACVRDQSNPVAANCGGRFAHSRFEGTVGKIQAAGTNNVDVALFVNGSSFRRISCPVAVTSANHALISSLKEGSRVGFTATPTAYFYGSAYTPASILAEDCVLSPAAEKTN